MTESSNDAEDSPSPSSVVVVVLVDFGRGFILFFSPSSPQIVIVL